MFLEEGLGSGSGGWWLQSAQTQAFQERDKSTKIDTLKTLSTLINE